MQTRAFVLVGVLFCLACGDGAESAGTAQSAGGEAIVGSCDAIARIGLCEEYRGPIPPDALAQRQARCAQYGGTYSGTACPAAGVVGSCMALAPAEAGGVPGTSVYGAAYTAPALATALAQCTQAGGTWTAR